MTLSLDGFVAGHGDGKEFPLGKNDGSRIFGRYSSGKDQYRHKVFRPERGATLKQVRLTLHVYDAIWTDVSSHG